MIRHRRTIAAAIVVAGFTAIGGAAAGHADTPDERFAAVVTALGIPLAPNADLPKVGGQVCDLLTTGLAGNVNPVPTVRGDLGGDAQHQAGLADAAGAGRGDHAMLGDLRRQRRPFGGAADE